MREEKAREDKRRKEKAREGGHVISKQEAHLGRGGHTDMIGNDAHNSKTNLNNIRNTNTNHNDRDNKNKNNNRNRHRNRNSRNNGSR